ncbi:aldolase [Acidovorax sp. SUPP950]|uniref:hypothetical protein n=1 Tax=Acidovorax sp. SUPP950 TaxID=511901 RepID=UPI0023D74D77|nr:hypothetical protein [Acidovorax sp. SUPP950]GKS75303.1 aldolase [Acidovorax sp. SUPP950]
MSLYNYQLCGWHVRSEIFLPELPEWTGTGAGEDLIIEEGPVLERLDGFEGPAPWLSVSPDGSILLSIQNLVRILIWDGRSIRVDRLQTQDEGWRLFLLGSALAYLCLQRGLFPLHAACVRVGTRTLAIAGHSGAGKSTLAAVLLRRGHCLLSDDLTVLQTSEDRGIEVLPAFPRLKLWRETMDALELPVDGLPQIRPGMNKYDLRPHAGFDVSTQQLDAVLVLRDAPSSLLKHCTPSEALPILHSYLSRPQVAQRLGLRAATFAQAAAIGRLTPVWELHRPRSFDALDATADLIEANFAT